MPRCLTWNTRLKITAKTFGEKNGVILNFAYNTDWQHVTWFHPEKQTSLTCKIVKVSLQDILSCHAKGTCWQGKKYLLAGLKVLFQAVFCRFSHRNALFFDVSTRKAHYSLWFFSKNHWTFLTVILVNKCKFPTRTTLKVLQKPDVAGRFAENILKAIKKTKNLVVKEEWHNFAGILQIHNP